MPAEKALKVLLASVALTVPLALVMLPLEKWQWVAAMWACFAERLLLNE